jgi:hypothetical protein
MSVRDSSLRKGFLVMEKEAVIPMKLFLAKQRARNLRYFDVTK